jgi:hypothetical protein
MDSIQEKTDAWIADIKKGRKEKMACQGAIEVNLRDDGAKSRRKGGHSGVAGQS